jgi:hypothetical protein
MAIFSFPVLAYLKVRSAPVFENHHFRTHMPLFDSGSENFQTVQMIRAPIRSALQYFEPHSGKAGWNIQPLNVLGCDEVVCRRTARTAILHDLVRDLLTFVERGKASALNGRDVNENVRAALVRLNEAETLGRVEPLNCSRSHGNVLCNDSNF